MAPRSLSRWLLSHSHAALALSATVAGLVLFAFSGVGRNQRAGFVFLQDIEQRSLDLRLAQRGLRSVDPRIVIVGIDEKTLQQIGSYPLPRTAYAELVRALSRSGARVVAFDVTFPTPASSEALALLGRLKSELGAHPSPEILKDIEQMQHGADYDSAFAAAMRQSGHVVLGHLFLDAERAKSEDPKKAEEYFNIAWAKAFPQVLKAAGGGADFDLGEAWVRSGGPVAQGVEANIPKLAEAAASYGFLNINADSDGTLRRALLLCRYRDQDFFPSLALQALREYEQIPDEQIAAYISANGLERIQFGAHELRPWRDGTALINYVGPYRSYRQYSMVDVIRGRIPADAVRDKIVLVGATALGIGDLRNTPFQKQDTGYMGVEVHANILDNLLHSGEPHRTFLVRGFREEMVDIAFIVLFGAVLGFWLGHARPLIATATGLVVLAGFFWFVYFALVHWGRWYSAVIPAATLIASYGAITSYRMVFEESEKRRVRKTFSQYLSPGVISLIEADPQKYIRPGGENKELTIMFSDIRGFTALSEGLSPNELVFLLNEYLSVMTDILFQNLGTLDKYIGDAIMAFWGSPYPQSDHAYCACRCALQMVTRLDDLNRQWAAKGRRQIAVGIGLNTGEVNVGNMGSNKRLAWTVMGDNVNLASRLEGLTKEYRTRIVISEATYAAVSDKVVARELDKIRVKGKRQPVTIYELMALENDRYLHADLLTRFNRALDAYRTRDWDVASGKFGELLATYPDDGPTQVLLQRCLEFREQAPEQDWDGVYVMKSK